MWFLTLTSVMTFVGGCILLAGSIVGLYFALRPQKRNK